MPCRFAGVVFAALLAALWSVRPGFAASTPEAALSPHVVKAGETLWSIGQRHGLTPEAIAQANGLPSLDLLQIGQRLTIPIAPASAPPPSERAGSASTRIHVVQAGDTLWSIAQRHGLSVDGLVTLNGLPDANRLQLGQTLVLAGDSPPRAGLSLAWPSRGVITSRFGFRGRRHHHGIDIAAPVGAPIGAALDGTVQFAGWTPGYGLLVILDHGNGLATYYGHASRILVKVGERVQKGQLVARVGATGNVTGPNVHFEVRRNTVPLDPLKFLQNQR